jgi:hypothetical protein
MGWPNTASRPGELAESGLPGGDLHYDGLFVLLALIDRTVPPALMDRTVPPAQCPEGPYRIPPALAGCGVDCPCFEA